MDTMEPCSIPKDQALLRPQVAKECHPGVTYGGPCPRERRFDSVEQWPQRLVGFDVSDVGPRAFASHDVPIGVAPDEPNLRQVREAFQGGARLWPDRGEITEHPPGRDPDVASVGDHRV